MAQTILTRFRELSHIASTETGYSDTNVRDNIYDPCLEIYNHIMDGDEEITNDTTDDTLIDECIANLCCWYSYREKYLKRVGNFQPIHQYFYQEALSIMESIDPSKIYTERGSNIKRARFEKRGKPPIAGVTSISV